MHTNTHTLTHTCTHKHKCDWMQQKGWWEFECPAFTLSSSRGGKTRCRNGTDEQMQTLPTHLLATAMQCTHTLTGHCNAMHSHTYWSLQCTYTYTGCKCNTPIGTFTLWHIYKALHLHMQCMQSLRSTYMPKMQPNYTLNWLMFCAIAQAGAAIVVLVLFIACLWSTIAPSYLLKHINTQFTYLPFWMVKRFFSSCASSDFWSSLRTNLCTHPDSDCISLVYMGYEFPTR